MIERYHKLLWWWSRDYLTNTRHFVEDSQIFFLSDKLFLRTTSMVLFIVYINDIPSLSFFSWIYVSLSRCYKVYPFLEDGLSTRGSRLIPRKTHLQVFIYSIFIAQAHLYHHSTLLAVKRYRTKEVGSIGLPSNSHGCLTVTPMVASQ